MSLLRQLMLRSDLTYYVCLALAGLCALLALTQHFLLRKKPVWARSVGDVLAVALLVGVGIGLIGAGKRILVIDPEVNPMRPAGLRLAAIGLFAQGFLISAFVWLPRLFDLLEASAPGLMIAVRQLRARKSGFLTAISFLAFLGVALSSFGLCFTISVMSGFGNDLKRKILGNNAHVVIDRERGGFTDWQPMLTRIRGIAGVQSATALVQGEVMVTSQTNLSGVILRGIDPNSGSAVQTLRRELIRGRLSYLTQPEQLCNPTYEDTRPLTARDADREREREQAESGGGSGPGETPKPTDRDRPHNELPPGMAPLPSPVSSCTASGGTIAGIVIGRELASNLHLQVGDEVRVVSPFGGMMTPAGPLPKTQLFRVAGIFYSGMYEYDTKYAYITIGSAQSFFNYRNDEITSIEVRVADVDNVEGVTQQVGPMVSGRQLRVRDWKELNKTLFRALKFEKLMMFVLLGVAILVASFAVLATLLLLVIEKGREIAIMKALGASDGFVARVFVYVGGLIGAIGALLGVSTAILVCVLVQRLGIPLDPEVYYIDRLPVFVSAWDFAMVTGIALGVCLAATIVPALLAARLRPVEGMRFG